MQKQLIHPCTAILPRPSRPALNSLILLFFSGLLDWQFTAPFWRGDQHLYIDQLPVYGILERPFVYGAEIIQ